MTLSRAQRNEQALVAELLKQNSRFDRRQFLVAATAACASAPFASMSSAQSAGGQPPQTARHVALGYGAGQGPAQTRLHPTFVKDVGRLVNLNGTNQGGAYWNYSTFMTPIEDFFIRNEYPTPRPDRDRRVDPAHWRLKIHGDAVERPLTITYNDLLRMPSRSIVTTLECAGNGRTLFWEQQDMTAAPQKVGGTGWGLGGVGQAEFDYVPMSHILGLVGLKKNAKQALFWSGVDGPEPGQESDTGRPLPIESLKLRGDSIGLAFRMNGKDLPLDHGGPVRALVPGWCGAASTKWLTEIKIASHSFWVRLNSTAHVLIGPDYPAPTPRAGDEFRGVRADQIRGPAVTWAPARSMLTVPLVLEKTPKMPHNYPLKPGELPKLSVGPQTMRGYAWAPMWGVGRVDYRIDGGPWLPARIVDRQINRYTWVRFEFPWSAAAGRHVIETRTTDAKGGQQPANVPFNAGGFDFSAIPKFKIEVV